MVSYTNDGAYNKKEYKVVNLTDTDTSNRPLYNDDIHYDYRNNIGTLDIKNPLDLSYGNKSNSMGLVLGGIVLLIILIRR